MDALKKLIITFLATISIFDVAAQDLLNYVPSNSAYVGMINIGQINTKGQFSQLMTLPFMQKMDEEIAREISRDIVNADSSDYLDLKKYGFNISNRSYSYFVAGENVYYGAAIFSISDKNKFSQFVKILTRDQEGENIIITDNYSQTAKRDMHIIWNNDIAVFFGASLSEAYKDSIEAKIRAENEVKADKEMDYDYAEVTEETVEETVEESAEEETASEDQNYKQPEYYDYYTVKYQIIDSITNDWLFHNTAEFIKAKGSNSYANNSEFQAYLKSKPDAAVVIDYGLLTNMFMTPFIGSLSRTFRNNSAYGVLASFYQGMTMYAKLDMQDDAAVLNMDVKYGAEIKEILNKIKKKKISRKFLKYMNKEMMGYYALGMDIEGLSEGIKDMLRKNMPPMHEYGNAAVSGMDILDILIDEKAIYNLFTGDAVLAVNGVKEMEIIHKSYDYDEEFNRIDIIDTSMQKMPDLQLMVGIGNKSDVQKIIDLLVNVKAFKKEGNLYSMDVKGAKIPVYFQILDDILFIGNNKALMANPMVNSDKQLDREHKKMFRKNIFVGYANVAGIARSLADLGESYKNQKMLVETSNVFHEVKMQGYKKGNMMHSQYLIQLSDSKYNSIEDIVRFINALYLINDKRI